VFSKLHILDISVSMYVVQPNEAIWLKCMVGIIRYCSLHSLQVARREIGVLTTNKCSNRWDPTPALCHMFFSLWLALFCPGGHTVRFLYVLLTLWFRITVLYHESPVQKWCPSFSWSCLSWIYGSILLQYLQSTVVFPPDFTFPDRGFDIFGITIYSSSIILRVCFFS
jgi:hypothetical protein